MIETRPVVGNFHRWLRLARLPAIAVAASLLMACAQIWYATLGSADSAHDLIVRHDIVFDAAHDLKLDVYAPHAAANAPTIVFFYGGSWTQGHRRWYRYIGEALASHGIVAVIPGYRKFPAVRFPAFMSDAAKAVKWTFDHAAQWGGDTHRIYVMGHSAGGHIAALLACDQRYLAEVDLKPRDLAGMIGLAGAYAFLPYVEDEAEIFGDDAIGRHDSQPINFVDGDEPPMLLLQGLDDNEVKPANAEAMAERAHAVGGEATLKLYPDTDHGEILLALARDPRHSPPVLRDILDFLAHHP